MTDIQAWLDGVDERLKAVKREPAQEDRDHEAESQAWSDLYQHAPNDLTKALNVLQAVLGIHVAPEFVKVQRPYDRSRDVCQECTTEDTLIMYPCRTVREIQDALGEIND